VVILNAITIIQTLEFTPRLQTQSECLSAPHFENQTPLKNYSRLRKRRCT